MIVDNIDNLGRYASLIPHIRTVEAYLRNTEIGCIKAGKHDVPGSALFHYCFEYETKPVEQCAGEAHKQYIDLHIIASGSETIGVLDGSADTFQAYDEGNDYCMAEGRFRYVDLCTGDFVIFFPQEGHMTGGHRPGNSTRNVKRLVFKLPL